MKRTAAIIVTLVFSLVSSAYAGYAVTDHGAWPKSWPAELEPLRKQARTLAGPKRPLLHYAIPFTKRDEFESAWPHLMKIKSKGAPIVLRRGPSFWLGDKATAGVCVHTPPMGEAPIADGKDEKGNWEQTIYIELIVDGEIIDLNRIPLPVDTPIIDERFKDVPLGIVPRAEATELQRSGGKLEPRVVRDENGHVTRLSLNDMKLSPEDASELAKLEHLQAVVLFRTGFTDGDLEKLTACRKLRHLNLTSTEVTDDAIDMILKFKNLESLCLGDVRISPAAIEKLKERNRTQASFEHLRWAYRQRKPSVPTLKAEVTCYLGKLDSGTKCSCSTTSPGDPHGKNGSLRCGLNERISITKWSFLESRDGKDVYRFSRSFEADTTATPQTKEIQFDGKRVIVFEDTAQVVVIQPPKQ